MKRNTFRILVTGASSGIGYSVAEALARMGHTVYAGARRVALMEPLKALGVIPLALDVTDEASVDACLAASGPVDVLVNNAGFGYFGAIENVPMEEARRQMEVNLFGLARLCRKVLPAMREQGFGRIVNISSVAGKACMYFGGWYNVSKYAVEAFSDALRMEVKPFGVDVVLIEPGGIKTDWGLIAARHLAESSEGTAYADDGLTMAAIMHKGYSIDFLSPPAAVTRSIVRAIGARRPRVRYRPGTGAGAIVFWHTVLPARWWDALMRLFGSKGLARLAERL
jgi:NAD(P)-dependent dehydrogenase (short-subunit alcohol dehydrogenase family)